jgi:hypothetical protein
MEFTASIMTENLDFLHHTTSQKELSEVPVVLVAPKIVIQLIWV